MGSCDDEAAAAKAEEQDQNDRSATEMERPSSESKNKIIPLSRRRSRLWEELLSKIVPWEKIAVSINNFPYYVDENTKALLTECVASHLKPSRLRKYGGRLRSSSNRILLQSIPGTELYRERLVSTIAMELQVPLLKLDCLDYDWEEDDSDAEEEDSDWEEGDSDAEEEDSDWEEDDCDPKADTKACTLKKGDRVKYVGKPVQIQELNDRTLSCGQRGEVCEVNGGEVGVVFNICSLKAENDEKSTGTHQQALVTWLNVKDVTKDSDSRTHDFYVAMELLYGVLESQQPVIVYFPDYFLWPSIYQNTYEKILDRFQEGVVMICAQDKNESGVEETYKYLECKKNYIRRLLQAPQLHPGPDMSRLFTNVVCIKPPLIINERSKYILHPPHDLQDQDLLNKLIKQIEQDMPTVISERNLCTMHKVLKIHNLSCTSLEHANLEDMILTWEEVEKIVGWATNHYLSSCRYPCVKEEKLHIPYESIKLAILRFKEEETQSKKQSKNIMDLATGFHERSLVSAVVRSEDIGVKFDDVGALENVKKALYETVILPLRRPELFTHGNLLKPCKGILLFGPPGTGKTLVAKALATESGANFINITTASITSMCLGETEHLTRAVFSYASKLAPVIIFVDEVDSLLGVRGYDKHATSRLNEFMAAWDGLTSKESQRILVIGATNRPFDLDEAVLRRMPRKIYVGLPDVENRCKILKILLKEENLESGFSFEQLAEATACYSGSDLKNLCVAAAYRPIEELLAQESKGEKSEADPAPALRPLNLNDFISSKVKVRPSVSRDAHSIIKLREWNEQHGEGDSQENRARN